MKPLIVLWLVAALISCSTSVKPSPYPAVWFASINDPNKPDWEILPQCGDAVWALRYVFSVRLCDACSLRFVTTFI